MRYWKPAGGQRRLDLTYSPQRSGDASAWQEDGFILHETIPADASGREHITVRLTESLAVTIRRFVRMRLTLTP